MNEEKKFFKIMLAVGTVFIVLTFLAVAVCYFTYPSAINLFTYATVPPAAVVLVALLGFLTGVYGRVDVRKKYGFKYSKIDGKAYVERPDYPRIGKSDIGAGVSFFIMSILLPFVFFFSDKVKTLVGTISLVAIFAVLFGFVAFVFVVAIIEAKKQGEKEKAEAERLRREQERREEMGEWK